MDVVLGDLNSCCLGLRSDLVTKRKKQAEVFRALIDQQKCIAALDKCSLENKDKGLTWDQVFIVVVDYVNKEIEYLKKSAKKTSITSKTSARKAQSISNLFKHFVRKANSRGPKLNCRLVLKHILQILENPSTLFALDYYSVLFKDVLLVPQMRCEISQSLWQGLLDLICRKYNETCEGVDRVFLLKIIENIILYGSKQTNFSTIQLITFFRNGFHALKEEISQTHIDGFLSTTIAFSYAFATEHRLQMCHLGETVFPIIVEWWETRPYEGLKISLVRFLEFQVSIHHPNGVFSSEKAVYTDNESVWKNCLLKMYDFLLCDIRSCPFRNKFVASETSQLPLCYLNLFAQTCHLMPYACEFSICSASKRHKKGDPVTDILDEIHQNADKETCIIWLQILAHFLALVPRSLETSVLITVLTELHQFLIKCKKSLISEHLFIVYCTCVEWQECAEPWTRETESLNKTWKLIYDTSLRLLTLDQPKDHCLKLLKLLILKKLVKPDVELWCLFTTKRELSEQLLQVLALYLQHNEMPKQNPREILAPETDDEFFTDDFNSSYRLYLMHFVLRPLVDEDRLQSHFNSVDLNLLAQILVTLCLCSPLDFKLSEHFEPYWVNSNDRKDLQFIETFYFKSTFNAPFEREEETQIEKECVNASASLVMIEKLFELILRDVRILISNMKPEMYHIQIVCKYCSLVLYIIRLLLKLKAVTAVEIYNLEVTDRIEVLFDILTQSVATISTTGNKLALMENLCVLCVDVLDSNVEIFIRNLIPTQLVHFLFSFLQTETSIENSKDRTKAFKIEDSFFDEEIETEMETRSSFTEESPGPSQSVKTDPNSPSNNDVCNLCAKCLCAFNYFNVKEQNANNPDNNVKSKLLELFLNENFDINIPSNLQLVMNTTRDILSSKLSFDGGVIPRANSVLRKISKIYYKQMDVAANIFDLIVLLTPHLQHTSQDTRNDILSLLHSYWKRHKKRPMGARATLSFIECINSLVKVDPTNQWARWSVDGSDVDTVPIGIHLIDMMEPHNTYLVQLEAACSVANLVKVKPQVCELTTQVAEWQNMILTKVCATKEKWKSNSTSAERNLALVEASLNEQCVFVTALTNIAAVNSFCEKKAIFTLQVAILDDKVSLDLVDKALYRISDGLGYSNVKHYLRTHFECLIFNWLKSNRAISAFPFQLMGSFSSDHFVQDFYRVLVPCALITGNKSMALEIARKVQKDVKRLVTECFPSIAVFIIPFLSIKDDQSLRDKLNSFISPNDALDCYEFVEQQLTPEGFTTLLGTSLNEIMVKLMSTLQIKAKIDTISFPINPPSYRKSIIQRSCEYIKMQIDSSSIHRSIIVLLAKDYSIQSILLSLRLNCFSPRIHEQIQSFSAYKLFVQWVFEELNFLGKLKFFLIKDVVHTLVYFILEYPGLHEFASGAIRFLCQVCECILQTSPQNLGNLLSFIVNSLLPLLFVVDLKPEVISLFDMLLVKNVDKLCDFIQALDPFPNIPELSEMSDVHRRLKYKNGDLTLTDEINCFLENCRSDTGKTTSSRLEGLRFLKKELREQKNGLYDIVQTLSELPKFSENFQRSVIHQLITELIQLSSSPDAEVAMEATRCLGEIGPIDLHSLVLRVDDGAQIYKQDVQIFQNDSIGQRNAILLKLLSDNLFNKDAKLVETTSLAIKAFLATKSGRSFVSQYENKKIEDDLFLLLSPFTNQTATNFVEARNTADGSVLENLYGIDWCPEERKYDYDEWITDLVCRLIIEATSDEILRSVVEIARRQVTFCQVAFPFVMYSLLKDGDEEVQDAISSKINEFFQTQCERMTSTTSTPCKKAIKTMLSMINYLRMQEKPIKTVTSQWDQNFWLNLDYLNVARAAEYCNADFSALMFLQIWSDSLITRGNKSEDASEEYAKTYNFAHILSEVPSSSEVYELILKAYRNIGDADGCYGFQIGEIDLPIKQIHEYEYELKWYEAFAAYSQEADSDPTYLMGALKSLQMVGNTHALKRHLKGINRSEMMDNEEFVEFQYECMWRLCQWTLPRDGAAETQFNQAVYNVVTDLVQEEESRFTSDIRSAYACVARNLSGINLENTLSVYSALTQSQILIHLEDYKNAKNESDEVLDAINRKWTSNDRFTCSNFSFVEPVLTSQVVLSQINQCSATDTQILGERLLRKSKLAREAKYLDLAISSVEQAKGLRNLNQKLIWNCEMEEARIYWERKESTSAIQKIRKLLSSFDKDESNGGSSGLHSQALGLISKWLIETKSDIPNTIMQHLNDAITLSTQIEENSDMTDAYLAIGRYSDSNYQRITVHMESPEFESKVKLLNKSKDDAGQLRKQYAALNQDQRKSLILMEKQSLMDEQEVKEMREKQQVFLKQALKGYLACLKNSATQDLRIFRVITLWFKNQNNDEVNKLVLSAIRDISSHKFLPLIHQLAARISCRKSVFQNTLHELIEKICSDHHPHTLYVILALCNAYKGEDKNTEPQQLQFEKDRVLAAKQILDKLEHKQHLSAIIDKQKKLCDAYISFSNYSGTEKKRNVQIPIPAKTPLLKLPLLLGVAIPTDDIPINPTGNYNVPYITSYEPYYKLCGGINRPKVLTCMGSDGRKRIQLLKGQDDLRQDAVMQQVFGVVNVLLDQNSETKKKNLHIRTYKVVPLSQRSGIVQWCVGTQPFGDCVISAHARYHPHEFNTVECRNKLAMVSHSTLEKKMEIFENICANFHPALHYFFFENFLEPVVWFERIQAYTKSVATSSIVGYILGLGDRHVANILLDKSSAEVIHIDLGVAFEQGKLLPIPEKVPFRLTRDVVDGMGITGIEGVFRKSCERTLQVLRQSQEIVLTLLEVLLYDPLYSWTLTPEKMANLQAKKSTRSRKNETNGAAGDPNTTNTNNTNDGENINKYAERVLRHLQQKLQGIEGGTSLSVIGQVNYLIKEAIDPRNLCALFVGWQPYL